MSTGSRSRSAPRSSPAIGAPMSAATSSTTRCITYRCWRRSRAPWTRRRRCGDGSSIRPSARCAASLRRASGRAASANTSRCCRLHEDFPERQVAAAVRDAVKRRLIGFDAAQAPVAGPHREAARASRPGALSAPAPALRRRHAERRLRHPAGRRGRPWLRPPASCSNIT